MNEKNKKNSEQDLYEIAFYYAIGILSTFEWYEDIHPEEIANDILMRASDIILERKSEKDKD